MDSMSHPKPDAGDLQSLWLQHKYVLHQLSISENKTLGQVKHVMETVHGFPPLRLHDYEISLREILKLRKNLKKEDWHAIGVYISNRRRQGKETEVLWNNRPITAKKVRKEVLRNRKLSQFRTAGIPELPVGMIARTPPGSPLAEQLSIVPPAVIRSDHEFVTSLSDHGVPDVWQQAEQAKPASCSIQPAVQGADGLGASRFRHLREDISFNRFMSEILAIAKSYPNLFNVSAEWNWNPGPRLFGGNPSFDVLGCLTYQLSNALPIDWRSDNCRWFLNWLSLSADFGLLKTFFSIKTPTACAVYQRLCDVAFNFNRATLARVLFEIKDTVNKHKVMVRPEETFLAIAVRVGSRADAAFDLAKRALECISLVGRPQCLPYLALVAAAPLDMEMLRLLAGTMTDSDRKTEFTSGNTFLLARVMRQLHTWIPGESKDDVTISDYIRLLIQVGILSKNIPARCCCEGRPDVLIREPGSLTVDEIIMMCPPTQRKYLFLWVSHWSNEHRLSLTNAGIFAAAVGGANSLHAYLQSCKKQQTFDIQTVLQECLLFAASLNDNVTASVLLQLGADPEAGLLSNNRQLYHKGMLSWNPMIAAAAAGHLEMLQLLKERVDLYSFVKSAPVYEIIHERDVKPKYGSRWGRELRRLENLRRHYLHSQTRTPDSTLANGTLCSEEISDNGKLSTEYYPIEKERRIGTLDWIRNIATALDVSQSFDKEILSAALSVHPEVRISSHMNIAYHPCDVLLLNGLVDANLGYREDDMDLLQLSIYAQCSLKVVEFLLSRGLRVHSRGAAESGNTMLHDALLGTSRDRSQIIHLLIREGADYKHCGERLTILQASLELEETAFHGAQRSSLPDLDIFTYFLEAGAPIRPLAWPQVPEWQPLVCQLAAANAEDELIFRVLDAGADLNGRGRNPYPRTVRRTPLEAVISRGREKLARDLVGRGADIHTPADDSGTLTALQSACYTGCSLDFIEYLVKDHGADVNEAPAHESGVTALQGASICGSLSVTEMLLDQGADVNALSGDMGSHYRYYGYPWTQKKSLRCRALDLAAMAGRLDMVEFLLKAGGRSSATGLGGAIAIAKASGHFAIVSVLLDWEKEHGSRIILEEAEWQQRNPDSARMVLE